MGLMHAVMSQMHVWIHLSQWRYQGSVYHSHIICGRISNASFLLLILDAFCDIMSFVDESLRARYTNCVVTSRNGPVQERTELGQ